MLRLTLLVVQVGMLGLAVLAFWSGPARAPGLNSPTTDAEAAVPFRFRFEEKEAAVHRAWAQLNLLDELPPEERGPGIAQLEADARQALANGPASSYAWLAFAWAEMLSGRDGTAKEALQRSWELAPESRNLAFARTLLAVRWWPELGIESRRRIFIDIHRARVQERNLFQRQLDENLRFAAVWALARMTLRNARPAPSE